MKYQMPLLIVIAALTLAYACGRKSRLDKKLCVQAVTVILTLFSGLRSWWMGDLIKYYTHYRQCNGANWKEQVFGDWSNIGLRLFFRLAGALHISYDVCIFLIAALAAISLGALVFRYSPSPYWSYLVYIGMGFYLFTYTGLKQTIAMSLLIVAAFGYFEGKPVRMILWTLAAALFHLPAIIFLLLLLLPLNRIDMRYVMTLTVMFVLCFLFKGGLVTFMSRLYYDDEDTFENILKVGGRFWMMCFIMVIGLTLRPLRIGDSVYFRVFNMMALAAMCQIFSVYSNNFSRLADYFYQFSVLFVPMILEPGESQARAQPERAGTIRYWDRRVYIAAYIAVTAFTFWYYLSYIRASTDILNSFRFFWQIDPYSLYGS